MSTNTERNIHERLKGKSYRDLWVAEHIDTGVAFQVYSTRQKQGLSQSELAKRAGMHQSQISEIENPGNESVTLTTLKKIASALDVALMVRFVSFGELLEWESKLGPEALAPEKFDEDSRLAALETPRSETPKAESTFEWLAPGRGQTSSTPFVRLAVQPQRGPVRLSDSTTRNI